ncbi:MAG: orotidine-5'-phosphate decarboxylase [Anaerolineae bacterium]|nr:orotidine-5'-phosphate decarboxylase [Anaerolineae bacterium]
MTFTNKLVASQKANNSWVCIGLDLVMERLPESVRSSKSPFLSFSRAIVEATADVVSAYKPNLGFWLTEGPAGLSALQQLVAVIPENIPVILDAKFNDIGNSAKAYARVAFETLRADAVTVSPYLGRDGAEPFLNHAERSIFLLARTSNASAPDLQDHVVKGHPLYEEVAQLAAQWNADLPGTCGLVAGATYPEELARLRQIAPELPFLIPGIGSQGGNLEAAVAHGPTHAEVGPVINSSRGIIYAWSSAPSGSDFAEASRAAAIELRDNINRIREAAQ